MKKQCPECKKMFFGNECECGFRSGFSDEQSRGPVNCNHVNEDGRRCQLIGTVSPYIASSTKDYPNFFCGYHMQLGYGNKPNKQKFTDWVLSGDRAIIDSDFDWITYLWSRATGVSVLELKTPPKSAFDYKLPSKELCPKGVAIIKETMPKIWDILKQKFTSLNTNKDVNTKNENDIW